MPASTSVTGCRASLVYRGFIALYRALPRERGAHQSQERFRVGRVLQPEMIDLALLRQIPGAEQHVPDDHRITVVGVRLSRQPGMMPPMGLRAADDVVQRAVVKPDVA